MTEPTPNAELARGKKLLAFPRRAALGAVGKAELAGGEAPYPFIRGVPIGTEDLPLRLDHGPSMPAAGNAHIDGEEGA